MGEVIRCFDTKMKALGYLKAREVWNQKTALFDLADFGFSRLNPRLWIVNTLAPMGAGWI